ncbi:hypothetical protein JCM11641_005883 [Rhodosporidiobolus odoratus]
MSRRDHLLLPLFRSFALSKRDERRYLPYLVVVCLLLLFYVHSHQTESTLYPFSLSRLSSAFSATIRSSASFDNSLLDAHSSVTPDRIAFLLRPRLERLSGLPILGYEESLDLESARCPTSYRQSNRDQLSGEGENYWPRVSVEELKWARERVIEKVKARFGLDEGGKQLDADKLEEMLGTTRERGLVFTAGNKDTMSRLLTSLRILRKRHGCKLPVEIFGFPSELGNLGDTKSRIDELGGIEWREIEGKKVDGAWKQFHIKGEAIARSSFSEILYLDSDNVALRDPTFLFSSPVYKQYGVVLWPDFNRDSAANPFWRLLSVPCDPIHWQAETGQLLVNKRARGGMNLVALEVARAMQDDSAFWFHLSGGDKDTFRYAFYFLSLPFSLAPHYPSALGGSISPPYKGHTFCGHSMLQHGLSPEEWNALGSEGKLDEGYEPDRERAPPLFVHANVLKHSGYTNHRGNTFRSLKRPIDDRLFSLPLSPSSGPPLSTIRQTGLPHRGICVDIWDASGGAGEDAEGADAGTYEEGAVEILDWTDAWGGLGSGFEDMYYDEGGVGGAW